MVEGGPFLEEFRREGGVGEGGGRKRKVSSLPSLNFPPSRFALLLISPDTVKPLTP